MADLTKGEIFREAQEKIKPITSEVEGRKKKLIENAAVIISFSVIVLSIILYAFNTGYCRVFNLPTDVMSLDMIILLPLAFQILSIASFILLYISSLKADRALKKNRFNFVRIIWGSFIVSYFFSVNNVPAVIGRWRNLLLSYLIPLLAETMIYWIKRPKKNKKVTEAEHQTVLEDTVQDSIFATYYIRYGIFLVVLPMVFAPNLGEFSAKAAREYQTCVVENTTYAVVVDYEDKVLVQQAVEQDSSLQIDTSSYTYFDKKDIIFRYVEYESVVIGPEDQMVQPSTQNDSLMKMKEVLGMPSITDWLMVIVTFIYVVATIFICVANIKSAKATRDQLAESKRQFDEANRAFVTVTFDIVRSGLAVLCIENYGKQIANNVEIRISSEFVENMSDEGSKSRIQELCKSSFTLGIGRKWYACLGSHLELDKLSEVPLTIDISYSDRQGKHKESTAIDLKQYLWSMIYDSSTEDAKQELSKMAKTMQAIEKKLPKA